MTGSVECDAGQRVRITANPASGTPNALGRTSFACSGARQSFEVTVRMKGSGTKFFDMNFTQLWVNAFTDDDIETATPIVNW